MCLAWEHCSSGSTHCFWGFRAGTERPERGGSRGSIVLSIAEYRRLSVVENREHERLSQEAYDQVFGPFDRGEFRELTDPEWTALVDGQRKSRHDPQSLALPPKGQGG